MEAGSDTIATCFHWPSQLFWYWRWNIPALGVNTMPADALAPKVTSQLCMTEICIFVPELSLSIWNTPNPAYSWKCQYIFENLLQISAWYELTHLLLDYYKKTWWCVCYCAQQTASKLKQCAYSVWWTALASIMMWSACKYKIQWQE